MSASVSTEKRTGLDWISVKDKNNLPDVDVPVLLWLEGYADKWESGWLDDFGRWESNSVETALYKVTYFAFVNEPKQK